MCGGDSLVPRPPPFFVLRLWKLKSAKNGEGLVSFIMCVTSGGREVDVGGEGQYHKYVCAHALKNGIQRSNNVVARSTFST